MNFQVGKIIINSVDNEGDRSRRKITKIQDVQ